MAKLTPELLMRRWRGTFSHERSDSGRHIVFTESEGQSWRIADILESGSASELAGMLNAVGPLVAAAKERDQLRVELESLKQQQEVHLARIDQLSQTTSLQEELEKWESQRGKMMAEIGTLRTENKRLEHRLQHDRENDGLLEIIDQRDAFHERIDEIADVLGDETEWSNCNDRGVRALELAAEVIADRNQMRDEVANLSEQLTESQLARIALSEELDQLRGEIYKERAIKKVETP